MAKAAAEAAELSAGLHGIEGRVQFVIGMRVVKDPEAKEEEHPSGGVFSLSSLSQKEHLNLLMEITQTFAKQTEYPLEMIVLGREQEPEG